MKTVSSPPRRSIVPLSGVTTKPCALSSVQPARKSCARQATRARGIPQVVSGHSQTGTKGPAADHQSQSTTQGLAAILAPAKEDLQAARATSTDLEGHSVWLQEDLARRLSNRVVLERKGLGLRVPIPIDLGSEGRQVRGWVQALERAREPRMEGGREGRVSWGAHLPFVSYEASHPRQSGRVGLPVELLDHGILRAAVCTRQVKRRRFGFTSPCPPVGVRAHVQT